MEPKEVESTNSQSILSLMGYQVDHQLLMIKKSTRNGNLLKTHLRDTKDTKKKKKLT